jgi:serine/threonine protein kinase
MSCYCINPKCRHHENLDHAEVCEVCGTVLLIADRYRLYKKVRQLENTFSEEYDTELFVVQEKHVNKSSQKILKILKNPRLQDLFEREVRTLKKLDHPSIPKVLDGYFRNTSNECQNESFPVSWFVMEKVEGHTLEQYLQQEGTINQAQAIDWMRQLVEILAFIHQYAFYHRDIKPSNIMRREHEQYPFGQLILIDFGSVRVSGLPEKSSRRNVTSIVSPGYTPLEQLNGDAKPQSDFYALGRSFVQLMTGKHPIDLSQDKRTRNLNWHPQIQNKFEGWFIDLIDDLMDQQELNRPQDAQEILCRLRKDQKLFLRGIILFALNIGLLILLLNGVLEQIKRYRTWFEYGEKCRQSEKVLNDAKKAGEKLGKPLIVCDETESRSANPFK